MTTVDSDDDDEVCDYSSSDGSSLPSFGSAPSINMDNSLDEDLLPRNGQISIQSAQRIHLLKLHWKSLQNYLSRNVKKSIIPLQEERPITLSQPSILLWCCLSKYCGVVQLAAQLISMRMDETPNGFATGDRLESMALSGESAILWDDICTSIHGIRATDHR